MNVLVIDCETTIKNEGNPFTPSNKLCSVGILDTNGYSDWLIEYDEEPYGEKIIEIHKRIKAADLVVGQNIKFDLHWLRRYIDVLKIRSVHDTQLAEFILGNQTNPYPSLDEMASSRGYGTKLDVVRLEYWERGIDTDGVPKRTLLDYQRRDIELTHAVYLDQCKSLQGLQRTLFELQCQDLLILQDMEWNGMLYDFAQAEKESVNVQAGIKELDEEFQHLTGAVGSLSSPQFLSCVLYGGFYPVSVRVPTERILKDGSIKKGEKWGTEYREYPSLVKPLRGTENAPTAKLGEPELRSINREREVLGKPRLVRHYGTGEPVLKRLKVGGKAKEIIRIVLARAELETLDSTYYTGLINKRDNLGWRNNEIHGQFNQVVARTGRLSSSGPNLQNFAGKIKQLFYSRYT